MNKRVYFLEIFQYLSQNEAKYASFLTKLNNFKILLVYIYIYKTIEYVYNLYNWKFKGFCKNLESFEN